MINICTLIEWPNSLTTSPVESPTVATYHSAGGQKGQNNGPKRLSPREKTNGVVTNVYLMKMLEKPKRQRSTDFLKEGLKLFMYREGISTPCARHKGRQPLIEYAKHDFKIMFFSFSYFLGIFPFYIFILFFRVDKGVALAPTYSQVGWENQTYVVLSSECLLCYIIFMFFWKIWF